MMITFVNAFPGFFIANFVPVTTIALWCSDLSRLLINGNIVLFLDNVRLLRIDNGHFSISEIDGIPAAIYMSITLGNVT